MKKHFVVKASKNASNGTYIKSAEDLYDVFDEVDNANAALVDAIIKLEKYTDDMHLVSEAQSVYNKLIDFSVTLSVAMDELE